jgi:hypothetical protein
MMKMKQIRVLGAAVFLAATITVGCSDAVLDTTGTDAAATYDATLLDETLMTTYDEVPTVEEALDSTRVDSAICSRDSLHGPGPRGKGPEGRGGRGGRHDDRGHDRDGGIGDIAPLGIRNYRAAAAQLALSAAQDSLFRGYIVDLRTCAESAAAAYRTARDAAFAPYKSSIDSICAAVRAGTITRDAARTRLDSIRAAFEAAIAPLNEQFRTEVAACRATFDAAVEAMLTDEQRTLWLTLK